MSAREQRVAAIRAILEREGLDGWYINGTDPHQSEYVSERWKSRQWISGFTGSAGSVLITKDEALLWVDSRYTIQGAQQIEGTFFSLMHLDGPQGISPTAWMAKNIPAKGKIGIDGSTFTQVDQKTMEDAFQQNGLELVVCPDYLEEVWDDRPQVPATTVVALPDEVAGFSRIQKLTMTRLGMVDKGCNYTVISSLDDIAWLTNLRSSDRRENSPVFHAYLFIGTEKAWLFTDPARFTEEIRELLSQDYELLGYDEIASTLEAVLTEKDTLYYDPKRLNLTLHHALKNVKLVEGRDITTDLKACKNDTELEGMRRSHLLDGVALVNFLASLDTQKGSYTEIEVAEMLRKQRERNPSCIGASFSPIAGWAEHGALPHYSATEESNARIQGDGLLVLDTGGMYEFGLTDVTRTILFGKATEQQKRDYTLVLKGNLALASARFPQGTCGYQLDILARQFLWQQGLNYFHGTGHGLGFRLNVHEGPAVINHRAIDVPLKKGMILSDEPGLYREGSHGIRIENILAVREDVRTEFGQFLSFEVLTLCPFERNLIEKTLLTEFEISMVDTYHRWVYEELKDLVDEGSQAYLKQATLPL